MDNNDLERIKNNHYLIVEILNVTNLPKSLLKPDPYVNVTYQGSFG